jgi:hypothetical protein
MLKKKIWANFQRVIELFAQKIVTKLSKIWAWDPRSGIRKKPIPDPGSKGQKGTGSRIRIRNTVGESSSFSQVEPLGKRLCLGRPPVVFARAVVVRCVAAPDPGSRAFLTPGTGFGMNNPDLVSESLETITFWVKILIFFYVDPG